MYLRSGIGTNKLLVSEKSPNPSIPTNSNFGFNFSIGTIVEYKNSSLIQFSTGFVYKYNQFRTVVSGITTSETFIKGWDPIEIYDKYNLNILSIPIIMNVTLNNKFKVGAGVSYDYVFYEGRDKLVINNTDPVFERLSNIFHPANYNFMINFIFKFNDYISVSQTLSASPNKTSSQLFSNSTGPSFCLDFQIDFKL